MATTSAQVPTREQLVERALQYLQRGLVRRGVPVSSARAATARGTDRWLTFQAFGQGLEVVLANNLTGEDACMPDTATGEDLDRICAIYGVTRSPGAGAQGPVTVTNAGSATYPLDAELVADTTKKRYRVVASVTVANGGSVDIEGIDRGEDTNLAAGAVLRWTNPPLGSAETVVVAAGGLVDGQPPDDDERLRGRLFRQLQAAQNGGSWAHFRQWAEEASAAVEAAWVYPAVQGPGTVHVAYSIRGTADNRYSRIGSKALTTIVARAIVAQCPEFGDVLVTPVGHQTLDLALRVRLPEPQLGGGPGGGWVDPPATRWPTLKIGLGNLDGVPTVSSCTTTQITCTATVAPTVGASIFVASATDRRPYLARIAAIDPSSTAGAWVLTLDRAIPTMAPGDSVSPASEHGVEYCETFLAQVARLAPGEKTAEVSVLPRGYRHPAADVVHEVGEGPTNRSGLTTLELAALQLAHPEITNAAYYASGGVVGVTLPLLPSLPFTVTNPPLVLRVRRLAFYP